MLQKGGKERCTKKVSIVNTWSGGPGLLAIEVEFLAVSPAPLTGTSTKPDTLPVTGSLRTSKVVARGWVLVALALSNLRGRGVLSQNLGGPVHLTQNKHAHSGNAYT